MTEDDNMNAGAPEETPENTPKKASGLKSLAGRIKPRRRKAVTEADAVSDAVESVQVDGDAPVVIKKKGFAFGNNKSSKEAVFDPNAPLADSPVQDIELVQDGAIKIGKHSYAINLVWRGEIEDLNLKNQAKGLEVETRMEEIIFHVDLPIASLIGFGSKQIGHASGMKALVTSTKSAMMGDRWIGAFRLGAGATQWWIGSMRDGEVFHDRVYQSEDDARSAFYNDVSAPGWTRIIAPAEWSINDSIEADLSTVLNPATGMALKHIYPIKARMPFIIAFGVIAAVGFGGWTYMEKKAAAEMQRLAEAELAAKNDKTIDPTTLPWFKGTTINNFVDDCKVAIERSITIVTGWETQPVSCMITQGSGIAVASWMRMENGRIEWLQRAQPEQDMVVALDDGGNQASMSLVFEGNVNPKSLEVTPWTPQDIERIVRQRFQNLGLPIVLNSTIPAQTNNPAATANVGSTSIQIRTFAGLEEWADLLADIPALVPEILIYTVSTGEWNLVARAYHPPASPVRPL